MDDILRTEPAPASAGPAAHGDAGYAFKTTLCALFFMAAAAFFAYSCGEVFENYLLLFAPTREQTLPWLIRLAVAALLFLLLFGVNAVLVRPILIAAGAIAGAMITYAMVLGGGAAVWIASGAVAVLFIAVLFSVVKQIENQVAFSSRPMGDKELALSSLLAVLVAASVGFGYALDASRNGYLVPPRVTAYIGQQASAYARTAIEAQPIPSFMKDGARAAVDEQVTAMLDGFQAKLRPYAAYAPYVIGLLAYFTFQLIFFVPGYVAALLLGPLLLLLRLTGFAHVRREMREVTRLTLYGGNAEGATVPAQD